MLCRISLMLVQIKPRKRVLDHTDSTASTRQHECITQLRNIVVLKDLDPEVRIVDVSDV